MRIAGVVQGMESVHPLPHSLTPTFTDSLTLSLPPSLTLLYVRVLQVEGTKGEVVHSRALHCHLGGEARRGVKRNPEEEQRRSETRTACTA